MACSSLMALAPITGVRSVGSTYLGWKAPDGGSPPASSRTGRCVAFTSLHIRFGVAYSLENAVVLSEAKRRAATTASQGVQVRYCRHGRSRRKSIPVGDHGRFGCVLFREC